jgi:hypothetical protein
MYSEWTLVVEGMKGAPHTMTFDVISVGVGDGYHSSMSGGGGGSGVVQRPGKSSNTIYTYRKMDKDSMRFRMANETGDHIPKVTATVEAFNMKDGQKKSAGGFKVTLKDVVVDSVRTSGGSTGPMEQLKFVGTDSEISYF